MTIKMQLCRIIHYSLTPLHVSSDIFTHHQEHPNCITASGIAHVCRCRLVSSHDTSLQRHSCVIPEAVIQFRCSWLWIKMSLETCRSSQGIINYPTQLHLVGHCRILCHDTRKHEYQTDALYKCSCISRPVITSPWIIHWTFRTICT